ncbi:hypothetical protein [Acinetobacter equi]|uniref:hypothetical protein n=1 Tax=Acinetobacter equi TaxID=1324350 RepID=UPI000A3F7A6A|nr:hypothetical protein [Acinetobacter equi]
MVDYLEKKNAQISVNQEELKKLYRMIIEMNEKLKNIQNENEEIYRLLLQKRYKRQ